MFSLTIKSIRAKKVRFLLTGVAVMLGVAFMAGTLVLTDTIKKSLRRRRDQRLQVDRRRGALGAAREGSNDGECTCAARVDASIAEPVRGVDGVAGRRAAAGRRRRASSATTASCSTPTRTGAVPVALGWQTSTGAQPDGRSSPGTRRVAADEVVDRPRVHSGRRTSPSARRSTSWDQVGHRRSTGSPASSPTEARTARPAPRSWRSRPATAAPGARYAGPRRPRSRWSPQPGVSQRQLVANISHALARPVRAGDHRRGRDQGRPQARPAPSLQFMNMFLMTFALVALVVGSFVIYNTFSITVAQRTKETALLRAIGAKPQAGHALGAWWRRCSPVSSPRRSASSPASPPPTDCAGCCRRSASSCRAVRDGDPARTIVVSLGVGHRRDGARGVPAGPQGREGRSDRGPARRRGRAGPSLRPAHGARARRGRGRCGS